MKNLLVSLTLVFVLITTSLFAWSPADMMDTWTVKGKAVVRVFPYDGSQSYIHQLEFQRSVWLNFWAEDPQDSSYDFYLTDEVSRADYGHFYVYYDGVDSVVSFEYRDYNDGYFYVDCYGKTVNIKSMKGKSTFRYEGNRGYGIGVGTCSLKKNK
jgi:hypothetical protein